MFLWPSPFYLVGCTLWCQAFGLRSDDGDVDDAYWADHYA